VVLGPVLGESLGPKLEIHWVTNSECHWNQCLKKCWASHWAPYLERRWDQSQNSTRLAPTLGEARIMPERHWEQSWERNCARLQTRVQY
jgi:hypothetical protein